MIESYDFGRIVINGRTYTTDVIVLPDRVFSSWWRRAGHKLVPADLDEVVAARPDVLVVGTGYSGLMRVLPETETYLAEQNITSPPLCTSLAERHSPLGPTYRPKSRLICSIFDSAASRPLAIKSNVCEKSAQEKCPMSGMISGTRSTAIT